MEEVLAIFPVLRSMLNRYVGTMNGGERKMTAIARALMLSPRVRREMAEVFLGGPGTGGMEDQVGQP
jgi:predicted ABC-type transport system involved in lysophospholipase L1 biosynthesis ATPase subunit